MDRDSCYARLRSLEVSPETADALAPILAELPERKREAFLLWAVGVPESQICDITGISKGNLWRLILCVRGKCL
jgi:DNA-directed RNA polymerase specialized sigma24 family protein